MIVVLYIHSISPENLYKINFNGKNSKFVSNLIILAFVLVFGCFKILTQVRGPYPKGKKGVSWFFLPRNLSGMNLAASVPQKSGEVCTWRKER